MASSLILSVDGESGAVVGRSVGAQVYGRRRPEDWAVAVIGDAIDGRHGENASEPTPGAPAGLMVVELSEADIEGAVQVGVVEYVSTNQPPASTLVLPGRDLTLTARGGEGEGGHKGGDGQSGMAGVPGRNATRETDATSGTPGGNGGNAGAGTFGGNGGDGGTIHIQVDQNMTHLLLPVNWDVRGGAGGFAGSHGRPGKGGSGGAGGEGHKWKEQVGWRYDCTENCITAGGSTTDRRTIAPAGLGTRTMSLVAPMTTQMVQGGNLQAMIAEAAKKYGALTRQQAPGLGACSCAGGSGHCVGCKPTPIHKNFQRLRADDGRDGREGEPVTTPLLSGSTGMDGSATIVVRQADGSQEEYRSCYQLELVEFDIEDENGDGIFEPGEHLFIRRMRVRNTGGMPSPTCQVPVTVQSSRFFDPVEGDQGFTYLPSSIPAGDSVTLESEIKVFIKNDIEPPAAGTLFFERGDLAVIATMPWLNKRLEHFEFSRMVDIQYPLELRNFKYLATMAQGSQNIFSWEIYNKSTKDYGESTALGRCIEMDVSFPSEFGSLLLSTGEWDEKAMGNVETVKPNKVASIEQVVKVARGAQSYTYIDLHLDLYVSVPEDSNPQHDENPPELQLIQQHDLRVQIAAHHAHTVSANFLLVTNSATTKERVRAIRSFIEEDLKMELDEWNIGLYGGLQYQVEEGESAPSNVITTYEGKTIIFLGNRFEFFQSGERNIFQLCDLEPLAVGASKGTSFLFLRSSGEPAPIDWLRNLVFPTAHEHEGIPTTGSTAFNTTEELATSLRQNKALGNTAFGVYCASVNPRWYRLGIGNDPKSESERVARYMRKHFPQERFLVSAMPPQENDLPRNDSVDEGARKRSQKKDSGKVAVFHGLPHGAPLIAAETQQIHFKSENGSSQRLEHGSRSISTMGRPRLDEYEAYLCVAALPKARRVEIVWSSANVEAESAIHPLEAAANSLLIEINTEISRFLSRAPWPNSVPLTASDANTDTTLRLYFPTLAVLLKHPASNVPIATPENLLTILQYSLASTFPQKKRHIVKSVALPFGHRRSQLRKYLTHLYNEYLTAKGYTHESLKAFHTATRALHSSARSEKRNTARIIMQRVAEFTRKSEHTFKTSQVSTRDVVPGTEICDAAEWNRRYRDIERMRSDIEADRAKAMEVMGKLIMVPGNEMEGDEVRTVEIDGSPVEELA